MSALEPAIKTRLQQIALERARLGAALVVTALLASLVLTGPVGVPVPLYLYAVNLSFCGLMIVVLVSSKRELIPLRYADVAMGIVGLAPPVNTIITEAVTGDPQLAIPFMLGLLSLSFQFDTRWCVGIMVATFSTWVPIHLSLGDPQAGMVIACCWGLGMIAIAFQVYARRTLVRAERSRIEALDSSEQLRRELEERRRAEVEREQLRAQFIHAQRMEAVGTLAAGLAHDMNNILAGILGLGDLLLDTATDPDQRRDLSDICKEAQRGAALTHSLVAFSRKGQYRRNTFELDQVIDQMVPLLRRTLPKSVNIVRRGESGAMINGDTAQLGQVLVNLCVNGADAMQGTGELAVSTHIVEVGAELAARLRIAPGRYGTIEVSDTGTGMDEATRSRIFEPFFTTKAQGKGTGLGLAMVYGVAEAHTGAIDVESTLGAGSTFRLYLPLASEAPTVKPAAEVTDRFRRVMRVLVVDDEPLVRQMSQRLLARLGLDVVLAENGAEAVEVMMQRGGEISMMILDMSMPVMGGAECFRRVREFSKVPILLVSGYAVEAEARELLAAGAAGFLDKPYTAASLGEHLARILGPLERKGAVKPRDPQSSTPPAIRSKIA